MRSYFIRFQTLPRIVQKCTSDPPPPPHGKQRRHCNAVQNLNAGIAHAMLCKTNAKTLLKLGKKLFAIFSPPILHTDSGEPRGRKATFAKLLRRLHACSPPGARQAPALGRKSLQSSPPRCSVAASWKRPPLPTRVARVSTYLGCRCTCSRPANSSLSRPWRGWSRRRRGRRGNEAAERRGGGCASFPEGASCPGGLAGSSLLHTHPPRPGSPALHPARLSLYQPA